MLKSKIIPFPNLDIFFEKNVQITFLQAPMEFSHELFFKITSTHRELSIPRVFDDIRIDGAILACPSSWGLGFKKSQNEKFIANPYQMVPLCDSKSSFRPHFSLCDHSKTFLI